MAPIVSSHDRSRHDRQGLAPLHQYVLHQRHFRGRTVGEIAAELELTEAAVSEMLTEASAALRIRVAHGSVAPQRRPL